LSLWQGGGARWPADADISLYEDLQKRVAQCGDDVSPVGTFPFLWSCKGVVLSETHSGRGNGSKQRVAGLTGVGVSGWQGCVEAYKEAVTLHDGTTVDICPMSPDDAQRLREMYARLSQESICFRFLGRSKELSQERAERLASVDCVTGMALVGTVEQHGEEKIIAVARYAQIPKAERGVAEAAIVVEDPYQGQGLGTILLKRLVAYAREHGVRALRAAVRQENARIMRFIERSGLPTESEVRLGVCEITVTLDAEPGR
jgi:RimJ/RimL family protein N-acetyltransferase